MYRTGMLVASTYSCIQNKLLVYAALPHTPNCRVQVVIIETGLGRVFRVVPQSVTQWTYAIMVGAGAVVVHTLTKAVHASLAWAGAARRRRWRKGSVLPAAAEEPGRYETNSTPQRSSFFAINPPVAFRRVRYVCFCRGFCFILVVAPHLLHTPQHKNISGRVGIIVIP